VSNTSPDSTKMHGVHQSVHPCACFYAQILVHQPGVDKRGLKRGIPKRKPPLVASPSQHLHNIGAHQCAHTHRQKKPNFALDASEKTQRRGAQDASCVCANRTGGWRGEATPQIQASAESQHDGRSHGREQTPGSETNPAVMLAHVRLQTSLKSASCECHCLVHTSCTRESTSKRNDWCNATESPLNTLYTT
jgi:hypothetical protein